MKYLSKKSLFILYLNIALGLLLVIIQIFFAFHYKIIYLAISIILTLVYFYINIFNLYKAIKSERIYQDLESEKLFNKSLIMSNDNIRAFKHDFNNIIQCIGGYISTNDMNGLKKYYSQLLDDCQRTSNLSALSPDVINNPAIYNLLASKYYKADKAGIKMNFEVYLDFNDLKIKIYELSRILRNSFR